VERSSALAAVISSIPGRSGTSATSTATSLVMPAPSIATAIGRRQATRPNAAAERRTPSWTSSVARCPGSGSERRRLVGTDSQSHVCPKAGMKHPCPSTNANSCSRTTSKRLGLRIRSFPKCGQERLCACETATGLLLRSSRAKSQQLSAALRPSGSAPLCFSSYPSRQGACAGRQNPSAAPLAGCYWPASGPRACRRGRVAGCGGPVGSLLPRPNARSLAGSSCPSAFCQTLC
jgi:hypothetical protein